VTGIVAAALVTAGYGLNRANVKRTEIAAQASASEQATLLRMQAAQRGGK
jgi:hypothetical protein